MKENQDNKQPASPQHLQINYDDSVVEEDSTLKAVVNGGMELIGEMLSNIQAEPEFPGKKKKKGQQQGEEQYRGRGR